MSHQQIDDFTIIVPERIDIAHCEVEVYERLDRLWKMVERYKMTAPLAITIFDSEARCLRVLRGVRNRIGGWHLEDQASEVTPHIEGEVQSALILNAKDAKGNVLKMRLELEIGCETETVWR